MSKPVHQVEGISIGLYCGPVNPESKTRFRWSFIIESKEVTLSYEQVRKLIFSLLDSTEPIDTQHTNRYLQRGKWWVNQYVRLGVLVSVDIAGRSILEAKQDCDGHLSSALMVTQEKLPCHLSKRKNLRMPFWILSGRKNDVLPDHQQNIVDTPKQ